MSTISADGYLNIDYFILRQCLSICHSSTISSMPFSNRRLTGLGRYFFMELIKPSALEHSTAWEMLVVSGVRPDSAFEIASSILIKLKTI